MIHKLLKSPSTTSTTSNNRSIYFSNINATTSKIAQRPLVTFRTLISSSMDSNDNETTTHSPNSGSKVTRMRTINNANAFNRFTMSILVLSIWPITFLVGLTLLGIIIIILSLIHI